MVISPNPFYPRPGSDQGLNKHEQLICGHLGISGRAIYFAYGPSRLHECFDSLRLHGAGPAQDRNGRRRGPSSAAKSGTRSKVAWGSLAQPLLHGHGRFSFGHAFGFQPDQHSTSYTPL